VLFLFPGCFISRLSGGLVSGVGLGGLVKARPSIFFWQAQGAGVFFGRSDHVEKVL